MRILLPLLPGASSRDNAAATATAAVLSSSTTTRFFLCSSRGSGTSRSTTNLRMMTTMERSTADGGGCNNERFPPLLVNTISESTTMKPNNGNFNYWDDRMKLQNRWTLQQKGWNVDVEWRQTQYGVGLFALQDISKDTVLRVGINGVNLMEFQNENDVDNFLDYGNDDDDAIYHQSRLLYLKDYLWGFNLRTTDERGYALVGDDDDDDEDDNNNNSFFFFGMWIPGNGLNHSTSRPNTVYRQSSFLNDDDDDDGKASLSGNSNNNSRNKVLLHGINLVALTDIERGEELYDDYNRHGTAPQWLMEFSKRHDVTLNFRYCNDFV